MKINMKGSTTLIKKRDLIKLISISIIVFISVFLALYFKGNHISTDVTLVVTTKLYFQKNELHDQPGIVAVEYFNSSDFLLDLQNNFKTLQKEHLMVGPAGQRSSLIYRQFVLKANPIASTLEISLYGDRDKKEPIEILNRIIQMLDNKLTSMNFSPINVLDKPHIFKESSSFIDSLLYLLGLSFISAILAFMAGLIFFLINKKELQTHE